MKNVPKDEFWTHAISNMEFYTKNTYNVIRHEAEIHVIGSINEVFVINFDYSVFRNSYSAFDCLQVLSIF